MPASLDSWDNLLSSQVTVDQTGNSLIVADRPNRGGVMVSQVAAGTDVYIGPVPGVAVGSGDILPGVKGASVTFPITSALYGIGSGGSAVLSVVEIF